MIALGIGLAAVVGFIISGIYYAIAPAAPAVAGREPPKRSALVQVVVELLRSAAVAALIAGLMVAGGFGGPGGGALLGVALWVLPVVFLAGRIGACSVKVRAGRQDHRPPVVCLPKCYVEEPFGR